MTAAVREETLLLCGILDNVAWYEACLAVGKGRGEELAKSAKRKEAVERRNGHVGGSQSYKWLPFLYDRHSAGAAVVTHTSLHSCCVTS